MYKSKTSIANVEKVVKDPNNPIIKKYLIIISEKPLLFKKLIKKPIKNDPTILTNNVPIGKFGK